MSQKIIGYYSDTLDAVPGPGKLVLEIGEHEVACIVPTGTGEISGFELFSIGSEGKDWDDLLSELQASSRLLNKHYRETTCYYNCEEAMVIPADKFNTAAAEAYLSLAYGEKYRHDIRHDVVGKEKELVNAYRIQRAMHDLIGRHFVLYQPHHSFSVLLNDVLSRYYLPGYFVKLQVYSKHAIICLVKDGKLQLIRSFQYRLQEDLLYYLASIVQQFPVTKANAYLELSGMLPKDHSLFAKLFGEINYEEMPLTDSAMMEALSDHPSYYFTPFFKLIV